MPPTLRSSDLELTCRLEAAEAAFAFALTRKAANFEAEAIAGGCAMFAGVGSPVTHAMGCGLSGPIKAGEVDRLERFFFDRGSPCLIDLCPLADAGLVEAVMERGYSIVEFNNLLARPVTPTDSAWDSADFDFGLVGEATHRAWLRLVAECFGVPLAAIENFPVCGETLLVNVEGRPVAAAGMATEEGGVAMLFGDATLPAFRAQGWQSALIRERIARAARAGCDLAMATVLPGSGSHRNYERAGFQLIYMRVNVKRERP